MNKHDLLSLANIGKTNINGYPLEVKVYPSSFDGTPWLEIHVDPLSPLHQPLILGNKWVEYITEEECAELPEWLDKYKREAEDFCRQAQTVIKATLNQDGTFTFTDVPEAVKEELCAYPAELKRWLKRPHKIRFIDKEKKYWYAIGKYTLDLDGVIYTPHWSYWLDRPYYEATPQIQKGAEQ